MGFIDISDNIGNPEKKKGHLLRFYSIPTDEEVSFKAFLTQYEDKYSSEWNDQFTYGRMDPISTFQRTSRTISLGWDVPAADIEEAKTNLKNAELLLSLLYPVYETFDVGAAVTTNAAVDSVTITGRITPEIQNEVQRAAQQALTSALRNTTGISGNRKVGTMTASPLFKLKFANLIMDANSDAFDTTAKVSGLVGKLSGLNYSPDIEQGFFGFAENIGGKQVEPGVLIPQTIKFSCEFTVLHSSPLGYDTKTRAKRSPSFPYHSKKV